MKRSESQWTAMNPKAVVVGSAAQVLFCITDARSDILELLIENKRLREENAALKIDL